MSTITVRTADELKAALSAATGGETIHLAAGDYGALSIYKRTFTTPITIQSDEGVVFDSVKVNGSSGVNFVGGTFFGGFNAGETWKAGIRLDNSSNISIKGATFQGWEDDNWSNDGFGVYTRGVQNITVEDSEFKYLLRGAVFHETDGLTMRNNTVTYMRSDGFDFAAVKNVLIEGNTMTDFPIQYGNWSTNGDHKDFIQFWTSGVNQGSENVVIRDNVLIEDGTNTQGIFIRSETGEPHKNFLIENNIVYSNSFHGITLGTVQGGVVRNNTVVSTPDGASGINISTEYPGTPSTVTLSNNITPRMNIGNGSIATESGTFLIQDKDASAPNYVGTVFPKWTDPQVGADLIPVAGTTTAGATLTSTGSTGTGGGAVDGGTSDGGTVVDGGDVAPAPAPEPTPTDPVSDVQSVILLNFKQAGTDPASGLTLTPQGNVVFGQGDGQDTASFDGASYVTLGRDERLFSSDNLSLSLDFRARDANGDAQTMFWNHRRYGVTVRGNDLVVYLYDNATSQYVTMTARDAVTYGSWQNVTFDYSREAGVGKVWVDGSQRASVSNVSIDIGEPAHWDVVAGSDGWNKHFTGDLRNIEYLPGASGTGDAPLVGGGSTTLADLGLGGGTGGDAGTGGDTGTTDPIVDAPTTPTDGGDAPVDGGATDGGSTTDPVQTDPLYGTAQPDVLLNFKQAGADSVSGLTLDPVGTVLFGQGDAQDTARFDGTGYVKLGKDPRFFGSDEVSVSLDFKAEQGDGSAQTMFWNHRRYGVTLRGDDVVVYLYDETTDKYTTLLAQDAVSFGSWQNVAFDYSRQAGTAHLWVNGQQVAEKSGLSIDIGEPASWEVVAGSDGWSKAFTGELRNIEVLADATGTGGTPLIGSHSGTLAGLSPVVSGGGDTPTTESPLPDAPVTETPATGTDGGTAGGGDTPTDPTTDGSGGTDAPTEPPKTTDPDLVTGQTPDVSLDFRAAGQDAATNLTLTPVGTVLFGQGAEGDTAVLDGDSFIKLGRDERFFGSDTLTLSLDFKAAPGHETDTQTIVWNHRRYGVTLRGDDMVVYLHDEPSGKYTTLTIPDAVKVDNWQNVTFDYSRETGQANVWVDGEARATRDGLTIDIGEPAYWDVTVGSDGWSKHFAGEVRNLDFLAKASGDGAAPLIGPYAPAQVVTAPVPAPTEPTLTRPEPDVLLNFKAAGYDATSDLTLSPSGNVLFGQGADDTAVFDGSSYVKLGRDERFFTGDNLSMSFDFKADLKDDSVQTMVWNHLRYGVSIKGEDILVPLFDATTGERASLTIAGAVKHGTWQNVTFEYSRDTGTANVWVDGAHRATREGIDLDIGDPSHWDVVVGSDSWNKSFTGEVRNLEFLQQATGDAGAAPLVGSYSTTLRSLNLTDYAGVTTSTTSSLTASDMKTTDTELFTVAS